ncbi:hypothetical protein GCM10007939_14680 [Amylibacter marinus]|uniref:Methyltransferase domain-containing protein n=1 Tax=Amylibacter marinus TaxID=1475483 RepID=A0ABQ5VV89_9RHOB|nr:class I SAM-dependent methyltransferase [Amylibacter marinus]GLQ35185.1 hypothetical protein GCM10007939_14680 [Amylibacter marinus]
MLVSDQIVEQDGTGQHEQGAFADAVLARIERVLPKNCENTVETGCGKSTILFSNIAQHHTVFALDDRDSGAGSSVQFFQNTALTKMDRIELIFGPTQQTLPAYKSFRPYDVILLDGPHGFPFVQMEYYHLIPHLRAGGFLIIDDVHIASIGQMADVLKEDAMFEVHALIETTLILRRTDAKTVDPLSCGWEQQNFNRRRFNAPHSIWRELSLKDGGRMRPMAEIIAQKIPIEGFLETVQERDYQDREGRRRGAALRFSTKVPYANWLMGVYNFQIRLGLGKRNFTLSLSNIGKKFARLLK